MWRGSRICVIVPAFNEARLLARMLARVPAFVDLVIVVDDASTDGTVSAAHDHVRSRAKASTRFVVLQHEVNRGVGAAIATGYQYGLVAGADVLVVMAGDDQMHPGDLEALLKPVVSGQTDYAKGNRFRHAKATAMPLSRRAAGRILSALTRISTGLAVDDTQCGYTAISAAAATDIPWAELWPRYGYPNDLLGLLASRGRAVLDVPVEPVYADEASGIRPWHALCVAWVVVRRFWLEHRASYAEIARSTLCSAQRSA